MNARNTFCLLVSLLAPALYAAQNPPDVIAYNPDGSLRSRGVYESNGSGQVSKYTLFDGTGNVQSVEVPYYNPDGKVVRADTFDRSGKLTAVAVYLDNQVKVLDPGGNLIRTSAFAADTFMRPSTGKAWFDGSLPDGATQSSRGGDSWNFTSAPVTLPVSAAGQHEHSFENATTKMSVSPNNTLYGWVYLDPSSPPSEVMLMWKDGNSWEHRAYWGGDTILYGEDNSPGRYHAGALPPPGQWVRLTVPASAVGLGNVNVDGMGFALVDGRANWGPAGAE